MERAPNRARAENPKPVFFVEDVAAALQLLTSKQQDLLRANSRLSERAQQALAPLSRREKVEYSEKVGEGYLAPLTHAAMEENERRIDVYESLKESLDRGSKAISEGRLPDAAFLEALRETWHVDRHQTNEDLHRLQLLRRKHADGASMHQAEYDELNRLPQYLASAEERLKRVRDRLHMLQDVRREEEIALGLGLSGESTHREQVKKKSEQLLKDAKNASGFQATKKGRAA